MDAMDLEMNKAWSFPLNSSKMCKGRIHHCVVIYVYLPKALGFFSAPNLYGTKVRLESEVVMEA